MKSASDFSVGQEVFVLTSNRTDPTSAMGSRGSLLSALGKIDPTSLEFETFVVESPLANGPMPSDWLTLRHKKNCYVVQYPPYMVIARTAENLQKLLQIQLLARQL